MRTSNSHARILAAAASLMIILGCISLWSHRHSGLATQRAIRVRKSSIPTNPRSSKPILFLHFHKSGGTSVCKTVSANLNITDLEGNVLSKQAKVE